MCSLYKQIQLIIKKIKVLSSFRCPRDHRWVYLSRIKISYIHYTYVLIIFQEEVVDLECSSPGPFLVSAS